MACFFVDQRLKDIEHRFRKKAGLARDLEYAKTEKRIEAFAIAEIGEGTVQVAAWRFGQTLLGDNVVAMNHQPQELGVACFFEPLKRNRFTDERIGDRRSEGGNDRPCAPLGVEHLLPERDRA